MTNERTTLIRAAYQNADVEASRTLHTNKKNAQEGHQKEGEFLKPIIFGGLDGILTSFAIVAGAAGGGLSVEVVLILGFSNIFADALSMGVGEFLSSKAINEWILAERERETWEYENFPEGEVDEMIEIFQEKGMSREDAQLVITRLAKYPDLFVDMMMNYELELQVPDANHVSESFHEGFVMFCSFAGFGALPLLGYVIIPTFFECSTWELFISACCITGLVLFGMGSVKSFFTTQQWYTAGFETLVLGGTCATVAYTIGQLVQRITGEGGA